MQGKSKASRWLSAWVCTGLFASACVYEFEEREQRAHGSVGAEMFRVVCMNLASQAFPNDLTGQRFSARCDGKDDGAFSEVMPEGELEQRALARFNALMERHMILVPALDSVFGSDVFRDDELRDFLANLIPLYDGAELFPQVTREAAELLSELVREDDEVSKQAILAFERMGARDGYRPLRLALGMARPALEYPELDKLVTTTLETIDPEQGSAREEWQALLRASAVDLATADTTPADPSHPGTLATARTLLFASDDAFSDERDPEKRKPLLLARRDHRGLVRPQLRGGQLPTPFQDSDGDGLADVDALGRLVITQGTLPTPFRTLSAALLGSDAGLRDAYERPFNAMLPVVDVCAGSDPQPGCGARCDVQARCSDGLACGDQGSCVWDGNPPFFYQYLDADRTLLAGVTRDVGPLLLPKGSKVAVAAVHDFAYGLNALLGTQTMRSHDFGQGTLHFKGPDTSTGPIFDLVHAFGHVLPFDETVQLTQLIEQLTQDHEPELAGLIEAILYIDERADHYPDAHWEHPHDFWDDLIEWSQEVLQRPGLMERMLRATTEEANAKAGPVFGNFMRFKDRVNYPNGKLEELEALGVDMRQAVGHVQGNQNDPLSAAVQANRANVNYPCQNPPSALVGGSVTDPDCRPTVPFPASNHKGIRGCPAAKPTSGASCADAGGYGLCSWDAGSCTCDCGGGLCRGDMTPTWTCNGIPTPGYASWVSRDEPDNRKGSDGLTNQSIFQRTSALVHDLNVPAILCNKAGAEMKLYSPAGGNDQDFLGTILGAAPGGLLGPFAKCGLMNEHEVVKFFSKAIIGRAELDLKADTLKNLLTFLSGFNIDGLTDDSMMERQSQIRGLTVHTITPQAIARMVFTPFNAFEDGLLELPLTRDGNAVVDLHRDTIFAWEIRDAASQATFYEGVTPLLTAFDEPNVPSNPDDPGNLDLFTDLISIVHRHWSSRQSDATRRVCEEQKTATCSAPPCCDLRANLFAYQSNGVSYEELVAEALVDAQLMERLRGVMMALDAIEVAPGVDGITVLARAAENLLNPAKSCVAGDCDANPIRYRNGQTGTRTNSGRPIARTTPLYMLLDALNGIDARFEGEAQDRLAPWREARSQLVDLLLDVDRSGPGAWHFKNPRTTPVLVQVSRFLRERLTAYRAEQEACVTAGGSASQCQQVRDWSVGLTARLEASLGQPVSAATLNLLERFYGQKSDPGGEFLKMVHWLLQAQKGATQHDAIDATMLAATDMLQLFENSDNTGPVMRFMARAIAPNAVEAVASDTVDQLDLPGGAIEKTLELMREVKKLDPARDGEPSTLTKMLGELVKETGKDGETPLEVILDTIAEVNRAAPGKDLGSSLKADDLRAVLRESRDFLQSERHGLERLYDIIQARELP